MNHFLLKQRLKQYKSKHLYRTRNAFFGASDIYLSDSHQAYLSFCSNDYLGLANHPQVLAAFTQGINHSGVGSGGSALICGYRDVHQQFEQSFADWVGFPRALLFANGYMANQAVLTALIAPEDRIYQDRDNHASLLDAGKMSSAISRRYLHNNCYSLENYLRRTHVGQRIIVSDGVFSMDGSETPLKQLIQLREQYDAKLIIDDAHGLGVLGATGRGILEHFSIEPSSEMVMIYPLGKAWGIYGALVAGSEVVIESLIQFARSYIYTTALPAALSYAGLASLQVIQQETWRVTKLQSLIQFFQQEAFKKEVTIEPSDTAIQTILINDNERVLDIALQLKQRGFLVGAMRPPTVKTPLLRISLRADHNEQQISELLTAVVEVGSNAVVT